MSAEGIDSPESRHEYQLGADARSQDLGREACPYGERRMFKRSLWLCGWHAADIALNEGGNL
ncbi:ribosome modulation factor [Metapseudomonas resinovorans]|uniref:hypothetical protein n=1 Tax=Metapseudomonas resinovorans TaxID=53412 RepID=UPI003D2581B7